MKRITIIAATILTTACAGANFRPMVDSRVSPGNYEQDLAECQNYARQMAGPGDGAVAGAVIGALLGAFIGHKTGMQGSFVGAGAAGGAAGGAQRANIDQNNTIRRCLIGRGYSVLN